MPAAAGAPMPAAASPDPAAAAAWRRALAAWLARHKTYPETARRDGAEGTVELRFTLDRSGRVLAVAVSHGSGFAVLDEAAAALLRAALLPAPPNGAEPITVTVRIQYVLTD
ncbi:MAG TPA: energy transducer TonB [Rhodopila sp.]|nr:energy transducer TonB [Rhodopila sp.]